MKKLSEALRGVLANAGNRLVKRVIGIIQTPDDGSRSASCLDDVDPVTRQYLSDHMGTWDVVVWAAMEIAEHDRRLDHIEREGMFWDASNRVPQVGSSQGTSGFTEANLQPPQVGDGLRTIGSQVVLDLSNGEEIQTSYGFRWLVVCWECGAIHLMPERNYGSWTCKHCLGVD